MAEELTTLNKDDIREEVKAALESFDTDDSDDTLEKGMFTSVSSMKVAGIPVGQALVGGVVAVAAGEGVDLLMAPVKGQLGKWGPPVTKLAAAWVTVKYLSKWIGKDSANTAALFLGYDAIRDVVPFDQMIRDAIPGHSHGEFGNRGLTAVQQAETVVARKRDYYSGMGV